MNIVTNRRIRPRGSRHPLMVHLPSEAPPSTGNVPMTYARNTHLWLRSCAMFPFLCVPWVVTRECIAPDHWHNVFQVQERFDLTCVPVSLY